jgi:hypothetical protein
LERRDEGDDGRDTGGEVGVAPSGRSRGIVVVRGGGGGSSAGGAGGHVAEEKRINESMEEHA